MPIIEGVGSGYGSGDVLAGEETTMSASIYLTKPVYSGIMGSVDVAENISTVCERSSIAAEKATVCL